MMYACLPATSLAIDVADLGGGAFDTFAEAARVCGVCESLGVPSVVLTIDTSGAVVALDRLAHTDCGPVDAASTYRPDGLWRLDGRRWSTPYGPAGDADLLELAEAPAAVVALEGRSASHPSPSRARLDRPGLLPWFERW